MTSTNDLHWLSAHEIRQAIADGDLTSVEATEGLLRRVADVDAPDSEYALRSVLALNPDAMSEARAADAGERMGPLAGVPVLVKDNIDTVGLPGTAGSTALAGRQVAVDAPIVARLRAAGAVVLGATNLSEWANIRSSHSTSGWSAVGGLTANPWRHAHSAGGSSSGSGAAVAGGIAPLAVGTETDGSITCPASLNGAVGIKPTVGMVSTDRVIPISASQDTPGPLARSVADAALLLEVLSGRSGFVAATSAPVEGLRVGVVETWFSGVGAADALVESVAGWLSMLKVSARSIRVEQIPEEVQAAELHVLLAELEDGLATYLSGYPDLPVRSLADVVAFNRDHEEIELAHFGQEFFEQAITLGGTATDTYRAARESCVSWASGMFDGALADVDLLVAPAYGPAWRSDLVNGDQPVGGQCTSPAALLGWPIVTVPVGLADGLPIGMAIVGRAGDEHRMIALAAAVERTLDMTLRPTFAR
jgi:amidase